jgi:hypothetical protein
MGRMIISHGLHSVRRWCMSLLCCKLIQPTHTSAYPKRYKLRSWAQLPAHPSASLPRVERAVSEKSDITDQAPFTGHIREKRRLEGNESCVFHLNLPGTVLVPNF